MGRSIRSAWTPRRCTRPTRPRPRATRRGGCGSPSTPWGRPTGRGIARAARSTRTASRNWPRSSIAPSTHPVETCVVSSASGMLTEGWDCSTVTYIIGLRPFMSQLLCEQVVGRGLRRASYEVDENGLLREEVAKVFGVPFAVIPFKANPQAAAPAAEAAQARSRRSRQGGLRDQVPAGRAIHHGDPQPGYGGLGERPQPRHRSRPHPARGPGQSVERQQRGQALPHRPWKGRRGEPRRVPEQAASPRADI